MKNLLLVGPILLLLVLACGESPTGDEPLPPESQIIKTSADELSREYEASEKSADAKYFGKWMAVSGTVSEITSSSGEIQVVLSGSGSKTVQCAVAESARETSGNVREGQEVTVVGKNTGMPDANVIALYSCNIRP